MRYMKHQRNFFKTHVALYIFYTHPPTHAYAHKYTHTHLEVLGLSSILPGLH
jgi:hypothetical protein